MGASKFQALIASNGFSNPRNNGLNLVPFYFENRRLEQSRKGKQENSSARRNELFWARKGVQCCQTLINGYQSQSQIDMFTETTTYIKVNVSMDTFTLREPFAILS